MIFEFTGTQSKNTKPSAEAKSALGTAHIIAEKEVLALSTTSSRTNWRGTLAIAFS